MLLLQAIIHPDTGEKILMPFRMSGTVAWCGSLRGEVGSRGLLCGPTWRRRSPWELSWLNGTLQVVWKRSHSAGRWLKPLSHGDGEVLEASEEANSSILVQSQGTFEVREGMREEKGRKRHQRLICSDRHSVYVRQMGISCCCSV